MIRRSVARTVARLMLLAGPVMVAGAALASRAGEVAVARPEEGRRLVESACLACHSLRSLTLMAVDRARWEEIVYDMVTLGAQLTPEEIPPILDYLSTRYGPGSESAAGTAARAPGLSDPSPSSELLPEGVARAVVAAACVGCHPLSLVTSYRSDRAGWESMVRRMVRLGARVPETDIALITDYLALHFGGTAATSGGAPGGGDRPAAQGTSEAGQQLVESACVACHSLRPLNLVRGGPEVWEPVVYDMISLGAQIYPEEVPVLVEYLARLSQGRSALQP